MIGGDAPFPPTAPGTALSPSAPGLPDGFALGPVRVSPPLVLAPMVGVSTPVLRDLIAGFGGCGLFVSEMISSRRVVHETPRHSPHLRRGPRERPFLYQLVGHDPEEAGRAAGYLCAMEDGGFADGVDLNMGCSAPAIRRMGAGAALLRDRDRARRITAACRKVVSGVLTVKLRTGEGDDPEGLIRFVRSLVDEGIDGVTLHPRLTTEKFKRPASWQRVRELRESVLVPVIGNGDIRAAEDVQRRFEETGCQGLMIGRLAAARPWIFRQIVDPAFKEPAPAHVFEDFVSGLVRHYREENRLRYLRLFAKYFARNFQFGHLLESAVNGAPTVERALTGARAFFERNQGEASRPRARLSGYW